MDVKKLLSANGLLLVLLCFFSARAAMALSINTDAFGYSAAYIDSESGLQYLNARYYKADIERFASRDSYPLMNRYAYADGDPVNNVDPSGHNAISNLLSLGGFTALSLLIFALTPEAPGMALTQEIPQGLASSLDTGLLKAITEKSFSIPFNTGAWLPNTVDGPVSSQLLSVSSMEHPAPLAEGTFDSDETLQGKELSVKHENEAREQIEQNLKSKQEMTTKSRIDVIKDDDADADSLRPLEDVQAQENQERHLLLGNPKENLESLQPASNLRVAIAREKPSAAILIDGPKLRRGFHYPQEFLKDQAPAYFWDPLARN